MVNTFFIIVDLFYDILNFFPDLVGSKQLISKKSGGLQTKTKGTSKAMSDVLSSALTLTDLSSESSTKDGLGIGAVAMTMKWVAKNRQKMLPPGKLWFVTPNYYLLI